MIRKLAGFALIIIGIISAYLFAIIGVEQGGDFLSPFRNIDRSYPYSAFTLVLTISATLGGFIIFATTFPRKVTADILLVNSLIMLSTLAIILLGIKSNLNKVIGFGMAVLVAELFIGIILIVLSFMEKPKAWISLISGSLLQVGIAVLTIVVILFGI